MSETAMGIDELCMQAFHTADPVQLDSPHTRWVMDLGHYKQIRAASEAVTGHETDPETWIPGPEDRLFAIPIDVRDGGGEPHLETPAGWI